MNHSPLRHRSKCKIKCSPSKICNPKTGRCVKKSGRIGKRLRKKSSSRKHRRKKKLPKRNAAPYLHRKRSQPRKSPTRSRKSPAWTREKCFKKCGKYMHSPKKVTTLNNLFAPRSPQLPKGLADYQKALLRIEAKYKNVSSGGIAGSTLSRQDLSAELKQLRSVLKKGGLSTTAREDIEDQIEDILEEKNYESTP